MDLGFPPTELVLLLAAVPFVGGVMRGGASEGRLLVAGPCPAIDALDPGPAGYSGSIVIARFESLEAARAWAEADPYVAGGVYESVEVRPFRKVLP